MNQVQTNLIKSTWRQVVPIADDAASLFYRRLFEIDPGLAAHFHDVDMPVQRKRLISALSAVVDRLDQIGSVIPWLEALGRRHRDYGASAEAYETVGAALLWTLQQGLGKAWSPEAEQAWREAYGLLSGVMQDAAAAVADDNHGPRANFAVG